MNTSPLCHVAESTGLIIMCHKWLLHQRRRTCQMRYDALHLTLVCQVSSARFSVFVVPQRSPRSGHQCAAAELVNVSVSAVVSIRELGIGRLGAEIIPLAFL